MKTFLTTAAFVTALTASAFAQMGNIHGTESRGEPVNSSYRASGVDPQTGLTPGGRASHAKAYVKKKKRSHVIVDRSPPAR
jgi:hypothetical protein